jgi:hypothetical protein
MREGGFGVKDWEILKVRAPEQRHHRTWDRVIGLA